MIWLTNVLKKGPQKEKPKTLRFYFFLSLLCYDKSNDTHTYIIYIYMINLKWYIIPQDIAYNYRNPHPLAILIFHVSYVKMSFVALSALKEFHFMITIETKAFGEQCGSWASFSPNPHCSKNSWQNYYFSL